MNISEALQQAGPDAAEHEVWVQIPLPDGNGNAFSHHKITDVEVLELPDGNRLRLIAE